VAAERSKQVKTTTIPLEALTIPINWNILIKKPSWFADGSFDKPL